MYQEGVSKFLCPPQDEMDQAYQMVKVQTLLQIYWLFLFLNVILLLQ